MSEEPKSRYELFLEEEARNAQPTKRCSKCGEVKTLSEFYKDKTSLFGVKSSCKQCHSVHNKYKSYEDRFWKMFWSKTERIGDCLEWQGENNNRIPSVTWKGSDHVSLRRVVYQLRNGNLPDDQFVIVTCNNHKCVKESHMKISTKEELMIKVNNNAATGDRNGSRTRPDRHVRGEAHPLSKLNAPAVLRIRYLRSKGATENAIAAELNVSRGAVHSVLRRQSWTHVK